MENLSSIVLGRLLFQFSTSSSFFSLLPFLHSLFSLFLPPSYLFLSFFPFSFSPLEKVTHHQGGFPFNVQSSKSTQDCVSSVLEIITAFNILCPDIKTDFFFQIRSL